jgi:proteasome lid subunit RPN8/RPN11
VRTLTLVDNGAVNPGILVRQPYRYADIGRSKATALRERLCAIAPHVTINGHFDNALDMFADEAALSSADLVVDATADRSLAARIERLRWTSKKPSPPILSVMVGHRSERGIATLALQRSTGAGADILRRLAIAASGDGDLVDVLDDFYPDPPRGDMFQPEPGCSDPTFIGSAADLAILAAQLLNAGLTMLSGAPAPEAQLPTRTATVVRLPTGLLPEAAGVRLQWSNDVVRDEDVHGYQVRIEPAALADMRREVVRAAAADHRDETGGVLLGQVDHGCRVVWVSEAYGLPPDSQAAPGGLRLNVADLQYRLSERRRGSRGMVGLIGAWHSHPAGAVVPSERDRQTMDDLVNGESEALSQALLVIVGGTDGRWREWIDGTAAPDMHVEMFFPRQQ